MRPASYAPPPSAPLPSAPSTQSFDPLIPTPRPESGRRMGPDVLPPETKFALLAKAKQRHEELQTKMNLLEQQHRTKEEGRKPTPEQTIYAGIQEMCSNTRLVSRTLAHKTENLERLTLLTNRVEEYLTNSLRQTIPYTHTGPTLGLAEMATELRRLQTAQSSMDRMLQSATERLAEERAEADAQAMLATNLRQSLMEVTSELERVRKEATENSLDAHRLREENQRLQAELKFAAEERQTLTGHLRNMVDTLAEENGRLKASVERPREEPQERKVSTENNTLADSHVENRQIPHASSNPRSTSHSTSTPRLDSQPPATSMSHPTFPPSTSFHFNRSPESTHSVPPRFTAPSFPHSQSAYLSQAPSVIPPVSLHSQYRPPVQSPFPGQRTFSDINPALASAFEESPS